MFVLSCTGYANVQFFVLVRVLLLDNCGTEERKRGTKGDFFFPTSSRKNGFLPSTTALMRHTAETPPIASRAPYVASRKTEPSFHPIKRVFESRRCVTRRSQGGRRRHLLFSSQLFIYLFSSTTTKEEEGDEQMATSILTLSRPVITKAPRAAIGSENFRSWRASPSSACFRSDGAGCVISPSPRLSHDDFANSSRRETHRFLFFPRWGKKKRGSSNRHFIYYLF